MTGTAKKSQTEVRLNSWCRYRSVRRRFCGEFVNAGTILIRQRGTKHQAGVNVGQGKDDTLYALVTGIVQFQDKGRNGRFISVQPADEAKSSAKSATN